MGGGRKRVTAAEQEAKLEELRTSYHSQGLDIATLKKAYQDWQKANEFLAKHPNADHPSASEYHQLRESTKGLHTKYRKLYNLERSVETKRAEERERPDMLDCRDAKRAKNDSTETGEVHAQSEGRPKSSIARPSEDVRIEEPINNAFKYLLQCHSYAPVCLICDNHIVGTAAIHKMRMNRLQLNKARLSVEGYEEAHGMMNPILVKQYEVSDCEGMLISPRARRYSPDNSFDVCETCFRATTPAKATSDPNPPKFSIANGNAIGEIPRDIGYRIFTDMTKELPDILFAAMSPQRHFGYTYCFTAGSQQSVMGHFSFFENNIEKVAGVMNEINNSGANTNIIVAVLGRMTRAQRELASNQAVINTSVYTDLMKWYKLTAMHPAFEDVPIPENCQQPYLIPSPAMENNTDESINPAMENRLGGATYTFTSGLDPSAETGLHVDSTAFALALLNGTKPKLIVSGGNYVSAGHELKLENVLIKQFPFGSGGPVQERKRRVAMSKEACIRNYLQLSLTAFKESTFILIANHMYNRIKTYESGIITCRSATINGRPLAEQVSQITPQELERAAKRADEIQKLRRMGQTVASDRSVAGVFLQKVNTSCKAIAYTKAAADANLRNMYAFCDRFSFPDIFFTLTVDDQMNMRVRLLAQPRVEHATLSLDCSEADCFADFVMRRDLRLQFPGACALEYRGAVQILLQCLFAWDSKTQTGGNGIFGRLKAYAGGHEEQGRKTLHGHWNCWVHGFETIRKHFFSRDLVKRNEARDEFLQYVKKVMSATYGYSIKVSHWCFDNTEEASNEGLPKEDGVCQLRQRTLKTGNANDFFFDCKAGAPNVEPQKSQLQRLRNARHKKKAQRIDGRILTCNSCQAEFSTKEILNMSLEYHKSRTKSDVQLPISEYRRQLAAYRYPYDCATGFVDSPIVDGSSADGKVAATEFWRDPEVRMLLLRMQVDEHDAHHRSTCFKKGNECRSFFPKHSRLFTDFTFEEDPTDEIDWYEDVFDVPLCARPFTIELKRDQGCQFLNTHSVPASIVFGCNTNVQMGSPTHIFYTTNYICKDTQKEDKARYVRIGTQIIKRLLRIKENYYTSQQQSTDTPDWNEGLARMLSGINTNLLRLSAALRWRTSLC